MNRREFLNAALAVSGVAVGGAVAGKAVVREEYYGVTKRGRIERRTGSPRLRALREHAIRVDIKALEDMEDRLHILLPALDDVRARRNS